MCCVVRGMQRSLRAPCIITPSSDYCPHPTIMVRVPATPKHIWRRCAVPATSNVVGTRWMLSVRWSKRPAQAHRWRLARAPAQARSMVVQSPALPAPTQTRTLVVAPGLTLSASGWDDAALDAHRTRDSRNNQNDDGRTLVKGNTHGTSA